VQKGEGGGVSLLSGLGKVLSPLARCLVYLVLPTRSALMSFPFLVCMSLAPLCILPMLLLPRLPTEGITFPFHVSHTVLLWFRVTVMLRFLSLTKALLAFPPSRPLLLFALNLPCTLAAAADALLGMVNSDVLLLLVGHAWSYVAARCNQ
jgi:hypothetical protein